MKLWNWIKGLFANPKTTAAGLLQLAGGAAIATGMATGKMPVNAETIALSGGLVSGGLGNLAAKDAKPIQAAIPVAMTVADHYQAVKAQVGEAQAVLASASEANAAVDQTLKNL